MIFWGTFFPLISELFTGEKASLAAPWFDRYTTPLAILLVLFTGIGPLLAWRRVSLGAAEAAAACDRRWRAWRSAARAVRVHRRRLEAAGAAPVRLRRLRPGRARARSSRAARPPGGRSPAARCARALLALVARNRRRYGGYVVHAGVAVLLIGIAASSSFQTNRDLRLRPGERPSVDDYTVTYVKPTADDRPDRAAAHLRRGARR